MLADAASKKGCIYTKIKIKDSYLAIFTTHLQATYFDTSEKDWVINL